jgi:hypothetical protein
MNSTISISFIGTINNVITESDIVNFLKSFIVFQSSYLFESEPKSSIQVDDGDVINITDTIIPVTSLIPKDKDGYVDMIAQKE